MAASAIFLSQTKAMVSPADKDRKFYDLSRIKSTCNTITQILAGMRDGRICFLKNRAESLIHS